MWKKSLLIAVIMVLCGGMVAKAACTAEEFQKEVMAMQASFTELSSSPEKMAKINADFETRYKDELMEFAQMAGAVGGDPVKAQAMLDKGCDLYRRMNSDLKTSK